MRQHFTYVPHGVCSRRIDFDLDDGVVRDLCFEGGCSGNLQAVARLVEGMSVESAIERLSGIDCGGKGTSCPDQLTRALRRAVETE